MLSVCARSYRTYTGTITCVRAVTNNSYLPYNKMALVGLANKLVTIIILAHAVFKQALHFEHKYHMIT